MEQPQGALTTTMLNIRTQYSELLAESTARYSRAHFDYNETTVPHPQPSTRHSTSTSYKSPHTAFTSAQFAKPHSTFPYKDSVIAIPSSLSRYGFHSHKIVRTIQNPGTSGPEERQNGNVIYEDHVYEWTARYLGLGFRVRGRKPYGNILPSLSMYPVVPEFTDFEWDLIQGGTIMEVQSAFAARKLHPFVRDVNGEDLYYVSERSVQACKAPSLSCNHGAPHPPRSQVEHPTDYLTNTDCSCRPPPRYMPTPSLPWRPGLPLKFHLPPRAAYLRI
jgi:hypothetical protein